MPLITCAQCGAISYTTKVGTYTTRDGSRVRAGRFCSHDCANAFARVLRRAQDEGKQTRAREGT